MTNTEIRDALTTKGWYEKTQTRVTETYQQTSYWYHNDPEKLEVHLMLVEDLTQQMQEPELFIYSHRDRWIPIKIGDLT